MSARVFCQWCAGDPGDHHPECPFGRAEAAESDLLDACAALRGFLEQGISLGASHPHLASYYRFPEEVWAIARAVAEANPGSKT